MSRRKARKPFLRKQFDGGRSPRVEPLKHAAGIKAELPEDHKEIEKRVPAKIEGRVVGEAIIYTDGTWDIIPDNDLLTDEDRTFLGLIQSDRSYISTESGTNDDGQLP